MKRIIFSMAGLLFVLAVGCGAPSEPAPEVADQAPAEATRQSEELDGGSTPMPDYDIVSILPKDAIPAIFDPTFLSADEADEFYAPEELVLGVEIDGDARAYSIPYLSSHEIVNDTVGGVHIAVTW